MAASAAALLAALLVAVSALPDPTKMPSFSQKTLNIPSRSRGQSPKSASQFHHQMPSITPTVTVTCEGSYLSLSCSALGHVLKIKRALFGRITPVQCVLPNQPEDDLDNIMCGIEDNSATEIVSHRCNGHRTCDLHASTTVFNDACPGIYKYLEVNYECSPPDTTTSFTTEPPSTQTSILDQFSTISTTKETSNEVIYPTRAPRPSSSPPPIETPSPSANALPSIAHTSEAPLTKCADPVTGERDIPVDRVVRRTCPRGGLGVEVSLCLPNGELEIISDLTNCVSPWVSFMEQRITKGNESAQSLSQDLVVRTSRAQDLTGGDIVKTTEFVSALEEQMSKSLVERPVADVEGQTLDFAEKILTIGNNILEQDAWSEVGTRSRKSTAMELLDGIEASAFLLAASMPSSSGVARRFSRENVLLEVKVFRGSEAPGADTTFPSGRYDDGEMIGESVVIPRKSLEKLRDDGGEIRLVFASYDKIGAIFNGVHSSPLVEDSIVSRPLGDADDAGNWSVNSRVLTASVNEPNKWTDVAEPISVTFKNSVPLPEDIDSKSGAVRCVFWDNSIPRGGWSSQGCRLLSTNSTHTQCACDHLTNFAVLMDYNAVFLDSQHEIPLIVITYAGCIISIVALFIALCTFILLRNLQCERNTIHKNLCFCLMVAELVFLLGVHKTDNRLLCASIAGLLHYFFLAAFAWMCLEGVHLYAMLVQVFEAERSRTKWYYAAGYGFPLVIVAVSVVVSEISHASSRYGTDRYCWLTHEDGFTFAFVGPVVVVLFLNIIFLSIAMFQMCKHTGIGNPSMNKGGSQGSESQKHLGRTVGLSSWIKGSAIMVVLLGLTWLTGLLFVHESNVMMAYIFTILNSLQGSFIFLFHCIFNEKVRKEYLKYVRRSSWMPDCLKICLIGRGNWSSNQTASPPSSSNSSHVWRWLDVRRRAGLGPKTTASPAGGQNSVGNTASLNRPILGSDVPCQSSTADNGGFDSLAPYERDMRNLSCVDASIVDSEAVTDYFNHQFRPPPQNGENRSSSQMSQDADDYLAPVSSTSTPTPIALSTPPNYARSSTVGGETNEEPLYHEIPENHVYAILEPPTIKSRWRPVSMLQNVKDSSIITSTLPVMRAPQPPTAPPPDDDDDPPKPDVTLEARNHLNHSPVPALLASFRKKSYSPHEALKNGGVRSPTGELDSIRLKKFNSGVEDEIIRCISSSPSSLHPADVIESHIKSSPNRIHESNDRHGVAVMNGCCRTPLASTSSLSSVALPQALHASVSPSFGQSSPCPPSTSLVSGYPAENLIPTCQHHPFNPQLFPRASTLPCGVDPRIANCGSNHVHSPCLTPNAPPLGLDSGDIDPALFHCSRQPLCHHQTCHCFVSSLCRSSCCSHVALHQHAPQKAPSDETVPNAGDNKAIWKDNQRRVPTGRINERDSGLGTSHILSSSSLSMDKSVTEANVASDTSDEELAQLSRVDEASPPEPQHQYINGFPSQHAFALQHPYQFQIKPSCKL